MNTASFVLSIGSREFHLAQGDLTIGRNPKNDVVLSDESVSTFHSILSVSEQGVVLKDLNTSNGTFVNGRRIKETFVEVDDQLRFGQIEGKISAPTASSVSNDICLQCGARVAVESKFCSSCGKPMAKEPRGSALKSPFKWWPSNQFGASVMVALLLLIFSGWTYQPFGTVFMLAVAFGVSTVIRYAYHRLRPSKYERQGTMQNIPAALWKRWPVRISMIVLLLEIPLFIYDDDSQSRSRSEYTAKMLEIEQEAKLHGENIDAWKNEDPFKALVYLTTRDGNAHDFGRSSWEPANVQQQYFWLAGMRKVANNGQIAAHQGFVMISIAALFLFGYLLYDGLGEHGRSKAKAPRR